MSGVLCYGTYEGARAEILKERLGQDSKPILIARPTLADYWKATHGSQTGPILDKWTSDTVRIQNILLEGSRILLGTIGGEANATAYKRRAREDDTILPGIPAAEYVLRPGNHKMSWYDQATAKFIVYAGRVSNPNDIKHRLIDVRDYLYPYSEIVDGSLKKNPYIGLAIDLHFSGQSTISPETPLGPLERASYLRRLGEHRERMVDYATAVMVAGKYLVG